MSCILRIEESMNILTNTEKEIANYILKHQEAVLDYSAQTLAEKTKTSSAAVVRLSKKIGFKGFTQLKIELAKDLTKDSIELDNLLDPKDDMSNLIKKSYQSTFQTIEKSYGLMNADNLQIAVEKILQAHNIYLFGIGSSGMVCEDFQLKLLRIGKSCTYYPDAHLQLTSVPHMQKNDLAFFVSYGGHTIELLTAAKWTKAQGVDSIAITQSPHNELGKLVDIVLPIPSEEKELRIGATSSRLSSLLIIDILYYGIAKNNMNETKEKLIKTKEIIQEIQK